VRPRARTHPPNQSKLRGPLEKAFRSPIPKREKCARHSALSAEKALSFGAALSPEPETALSLDTEEPLPTTQMRRRSRSVGRSGNRLQGTHRAPQSQSGESVHRRRHRQPLSRCRVEFGSQGRRAGPGGLRFGAFLGDWKRGDLGDHLPDRRESRRGASLHFRPLFAFVNDENRDERKNPSSLVRGAWIRASFRRRLLRRSKYARLRSGHGPQQSTRSLLVRASARGLGHALRGYPACRRPKRRRFAAAG